MDKSDLACRICGKIQDEPPWGDDGQCPTYNICECCGVEFGYEDCNLQAIKSFREEWISLGTKWAHPKEKPTDWSLEEQMRNVSKEYT